MTGLLLTIVLVSATGDTLKVPSFSPVDSVLIMVPQDMPAFHPSVSERHEGAVELAALVQLRHPRRDGMVVVLVNPHHLSGPTLQRTFDLMKAEHRAITSARRTVLPLQGRTGSSSGLLAVAPQRGGPRASATVEEGVLALLAVLEGTPIQEVPGLGEGRAIMISAPRAWALAREVRQP